MQSHMAILIAYCIGMKKRPSNIVEFCNFCWKTAKNVPFHIKSPVKKFSRLGQRGGIAPCPPPNTPLVARTVNTLSHLIMQAYT